MKLCVILVSVLVIAVALMSCSSSSLPRWSEQNIRERILRDTPRGSTYTTVLNFVKKQGWSMAEQPGGYEIPKFGTTPARVVGKRTIKAYLGGYRGLPWHVDVDCFWAFDDQDKLIDVFVDKQTDAP
jgi:hypothetical protein